MRKNVLVKTNSSYVARSHTLSPRTILNGKYLLGAVLGEGGFGITYIARDINLDMRVAVKEYYPKTDVNRTTDTSLSVVPVTEDANVRFEKGKNNFLN